MASHELETETERMMEQDPGPEFRDVQNAACSPLLDGLAVDVAVPVPPCNAAWHSAAKLHCAPPPSRLRGRLSANGPASELALRRRQRDRMCSSFPTCRRRKHRRVSGLRRGAVTHDVRASVPPVTAPLVSDPDTRHCMQIEPVRPPRRNGCTTLHRRGAHRGPNRGGEMRGRWDHRVRDDRTNRESLRDKVVAKTPAQSTPVELDTRAPPPNAPQKPTGVDPWFSAGSLLTCAVRSRWGSGMGVGAGKRGSPSPSTRPPPLFTETAPAFSRCPVRAV